MQGVTIRPGIPSDGVSAYKILTSRSGARGTLQIPYTSQERWVKRFTDPTEGLYPFVAEKDGQVVGYLSLTIFSSPRRRHAGDIGMAVREDMQGKGVGSALLKTCLETADNWLNLTRIELSVYTDNERAIHLYEKFGFVKEGLCRQFAFREGSYADVYMMARIRTT